LGGPLEGPVLQQGELSMVCVGLSEEDLKIFGGATGVARQNVGGEVLRPCIRRTGYPHPRLYYSLPSFSRVTPMHM